MAYPRIAKAIKTSNLTTEQLELVTLSTIIATALARIVVPAGITVT